MSNRNGRDSIKRLGRNDDRRRGFVVLVGSWRVALFVLAGKILEPSSESRVYLPAFYAIWVLRGMPVKSISCQTGFCPVYLFFFKNKQ